MNLPNCVGYQCDEGSFLRPHVIAVPRGCSRSHGDKEVDTIDSLNLPSAVNGDRFLTQIESIDPSRHWANAPLNLHRSPPPDFLARDDR